MATHEMPPAIADSASMGMNTNEVSIRGSAITHRSTKVAIETTPAISRHLLAVLEVSTLMSVPSRLMDMGRRCCAFDELSPFGQDKPGAH
jgi:hypothetical protein